MRRAVAVTLAVVSFVSAAPVPKKPAEKPTPEQALEEFRTRWNKMAGDTGPKWKEGAFPHPTFAGGSAKAYGDFARHLAAFLDEKGNLDYLTDNGLTDTPLAYAALKSNWLLPKLVADFARDDAPGDHDADIRKALGKHAESMNKAKK